MYPHDIFLSQIKKLSKWPVAFDPQKFYIWIQFNMGKDKRPEF